jgi:SAM-dependent methyltransferase
LVLELGCGTGLCAALFRPAAARLVGVDVSARMLERARARGLYDELLLGDAVQVSSQQQQRVWPCCRTERACPVVRTERVLLQHHGTGNIYYHRYENVGKSQPALMIVDRVAMCGRARQVMAGRFVGGEVALVLAVDVFVYLGSLAEVLAEAARVLRPGCVQLRVQVEIMQNCIGKSQSVLSISSIPSSSPAPGACTADRGARTEGCWPSRSRSCCRRHQR